MLLKIVYGVGQNLYYTDVKTINFIAHHSDSATMLNIGAPAVPGTRVIHSEDFLKDQIGCSPAGDADNMYYLNSIFVTTKSGEEETVVFTGSAYLCDDKGNTVDTLR